MNRFRPNLVVSEADAPYAEDRWQAIRIDGVTFDLVKPCKRCAVTTTDQVTGKRGKEPLRTLETYRASPSGGPLFGQNAVHRATGTIHVGAKVEVLEFQ